MQLQAAADRIGGSSSRAVAPSDVSRTSNLPRLRESPCSTFPFREILAGIRREFDESLSKVSAWLTPAVRPGREVGDSEGAPPPCRTGDGAIRRVRTKATSHRSAGSPGATPPPSPGRGGRPESQPPK